MRMRKFAGAVLAAAVMLVPSLGHSVGENSAINGTPCTVGDMTFGYDVDGGGWAGTSALTCTLERGSLVTSFRVYHVTGVNTLQRPYLFGREVMKSTQFGDPSLYFYGCLACSAVTAQGFTQDNLQPGLYAMYAEGWVTHTLRDGTQKTWAGYHTSCFVVSNSSNPTQMIPTCSV